MNSFWTGFLIGGAIIGTLFFVGNQAINKYIKKKNSKYFKYVVPSILLCIALIILFVNLEAIAKPNPIGDQTVLQYVLTNKAILHLLIYVGTLSMVGVIWILATFPFSFDGIKKFSVFGVSAEFNEKVQEAVDNMILLNEVSSIRENIMKVIISEKYYEETLTSVIVLNDGKYSIDTSALLIATLDTIKSAYASSESKIALKFHLEDVKSNDVNEAKQNVSELQNEMKEACLNVIRDGKSYVWKGTIAFATAPFDIDSQRNAFYILCIHSDDIEFTEKDIDFMQTVINLMEKLVDLQWYENIVLSDDEETEDSVVS
ncbi:hypothetical protein [Halalkalibacter nanhaiisediminis]|uniref:Uncharacterized protein n=1 Tax=Halalkalibacter nanhaiisediminis TaxID=688079 RepID=A0A562QJH8_9BACI|nr:hypothetical protein [Halalkalibacter nanhaiisediminis]TWI56340.1 hypothetical protein IQ10_02234 [Halalkalibacter nanhaiisediminis]